MLGSYDAAIQVFGDAIQQAPKDWDLWHNQGLCYMAAKDYDRYMTSSNQSGSKYQCNTSHDGAGQQDACNRQMG